MKSSFPFSKQIYFLLIVLITFSVEVRAWWDVPHMLIAQIARDQLTPSVTEKVEKLIGYYGEDFPESNTFVTAACFPDDITSIGLSGFKVWHGVLTPYSPDNFLTDKEIRSIQALVSNNNLHSAIQQSLKTLNDPHAKKWAKCFMLRFLLHCVADIHQPLHCIQYYSQELPNGDSAGHKFTITGTPYKNLHLLWDAAFGIGAVRMQRPLNAKDEAWIQQTALDIQRMYPKKILPEYSNLNYREWSQESYQIAVNIVYKDIKIGDTPTTEYLAIGEQTAMRQIALAGYRLGLLLNEIFEE